MRIGEIIIFSVLLNATLLATAKSPILPTAPKRGLGPRPRKPLSPFASFKCKVVERPSRWTGLATGTKAKLDEYVVASYVYGSTSHPERSQPRAVIFAETDHHIMKSIEFAYENKCAIACRSGSHHFGGFGSSAGQDITLDLSSFNKAVYDEHNDVYTIGVGTKLGDLSNLMKANGQMVPHGECTWVRVGGHMQTGGYSPFFSRSFGFFCDHVVEFTIILPPTKDNPKPEKVVVKKPMAHNSEDRNSDLWWAVQGGSPGNLGVITEMKVRGIKDEDHSDARSMSISFLYDENGMEKFRTLMEILVEYADDDDLPADYVFNLICLAGNSPWSKIKKSRQNLDVKMAMAHPEIFGPHLGKVPSFVTLIVNWNNCKGRVVQFGDYDGEYCAKEIFADIRRRTSHIALKPGDYLLRLMGRFKMEVLSMSESRPRRLSEINKISSFAERYGANPYMGMQRWNDCANKLAQRSRRPYTGSSYALSVANIVDRAMSHKENGVWVTPQWGISGGRHSMIRKENCKNYNILSQRDASLSHLYYIHYDSVRDGKDTEVPGIIAERNLRDMVKCTDKWLGQDRRWLAFCGEDENLDLMHSHYYDSEDDYQRLLAIKRKIDPFDVFTPNLFCVGASRKFGVAPLGLQTQTTLVNNIDDEDLVKYLRKPEQSHGDRQQRSRTEQERTQHDIALTVLETKRERASK